LKSFKADSKLCEIFGILNGDGHVSKTTHEISVVGNKLERDYALYVKDVFQKMFGLDFKLYFNSNSFKVRVYSKELAAKLNKKYNIPLGNKMGQLNIPPIVYTKKKWIFSYIRGLFDTDGCFHIRRKKDALVSITSADPRYLMEISEALISCGFNVSRGQQKVMLYGRDSVSKFFRKIRPANSKHLKKYEEYLKL